MSDIYKHNGAPARREKLSSCYKAMIVTTFLVVVGAAAFAGLALANVIAVPGLSPTEGPGPSPSPAPNGALRGGGAVDRPAPSPVEHFSAPAGAPRLVPAAGAHPPAAPARAGARPAHNPDARGAEGGGAHLPVEKQTLGRSGVVKFDARERGVPPRKAWKLLAGVAGRAACVDVREFPAGVRARLAEAVRTAHEQGEKGVRLATATECEGALLARRRDAPDADASMGARSFGVPSEAAAAANLAKLAGRKLADMMVPAVSSTDLLTTSNTLNFGKLAPSVPSPAAGDSDGEGAGAPAAGGIGGGVSVNTDALAHAAAAMAAAPAAGFVYARNLAVLSRFFTTVVKFDWQLYYGARCRHEYKDSNSALKTEFDFRPNGGRCKPGAGAAPAAYRKPCLYHPRVSPAALNACVGPDCNFANIAAAMQAKSDEMYRSSVSVVRFVQPAGTKEAVLRTNAGLGSADDDKRKVQTAAALFSTNEGASHCPAAPWTHRTLLGGSHLLSPNPDTADWDDSWRVYALDQSKGFKGRMYVENYPHSFVMDAEVNLKTSLEAEIKAAIKAKKPDANSVSVDVTMLDPRSFSVYTRLTLDRDKWYAATKYIQTRSSYQIVHAKNTIQVGIFHRSWAWQTSSSVLWFVADALDDGASGMARDVSAEVSATLADQFAGSLPSGGAAGGVVDAGTTTLTLGNDGRVFALIAL